MNSQNRDLPKGQLVMLDNKTYTRPRLIRVISGPGLSAADESSDAVGADMGTGDEIEFDAMTIAWVVPG